MALITGTIGTDTLTGTGADDILQSYSTDSIDTLRGLGGADEYDLRRSGTSMTYNFLIDDAGGDGAANIITGVGALYYSASFAYQDYATALRVGDDLILHTPNRPYRFRKPAKPDYDIEIKDQYGDGHITSIEAGGITYLLSLDFNGSAEADLMAGTHQGETIHAGDGNNWIFGNGGRDTITMGTGNDTVFGGRGGDTITDPGGNNLIFSENGSDRITTGDGNDRIETGQGNDKVWAGDGNDSVEGGDGRDRLNGQDGDDVLKGDAGNDILRGGKGSDHLYAGAGDDLMIGGKGGDHYYVSSLDGGTDRIHDKGDAPYIPYYATAKNDVLVITGFSDLDAAMHGLDVQLSGDDLVLITDNPATTPGTIGQITIQDHFQGARFAIEKIAFGGSNLASDFNIVLLEGDLKTFSVHSGSDVGGNDIVLGTDGDDELYGGINNNIYLGGTGADVFLFKDQEDNRGGLDLILDFDLAEDRLDVSEIEGISFASFTVSDNAYGNAVISSVYETIELVGITASSVTESLFIFDGG